MGAMRRGTSMIEIMVVVVLLGLAIVPLMNLGGSTHRQTFFTEHQLMAMGRARMVLDVGASVDFEVYDALAQKRNDQPVKVDLEKLLGGGLAALYAVTLAPANASYAVKLENLAHELEFVRLDDVSGMLTARVAWTFAADRENRTHRVQLSRLVHRREVVANRRYDLQ